MTAEPNRHRLSMAVFYDPDALWTTVIELLSCSVTINQQCCAGRALVLSLLAPPSSVSPDMAAQLWPLVHDVEPFASAAGAKDVMATSGSVLKTLTFACPARGGFKSSVVLTPQGPEPRDDACVTLRQHIGAGAVLLVVGAETPGQQAKSSQVLLRRSPQSVHTFEFSTRPSA